MSDVFNHPWLSGLFGDAEVDSIWSGERSLAHMLAFEAAYSRGLGLIGNASPEEARMAAEWIEQAKPRMEDLRSGTLQDGLPIPALVRGLKADAGSFAGAIHSGTTSQDVIDTALAMTLRENSDLLMARLSGLIGRLDQLIESFGTNTLMGRTRMQAALPITAGHRIASWRAPLKAHQNRLAQIRPHIECVQLGGAVGDCQAIGAGHRDLAAFIADALHLHLPDQSWHSARDGIAEYANLLSLVTGALGKIGQDICLMAQQGIDEITLSGGGTSSAMPHKQNPILAELLVTLARYNATQIAGMHQALVHEQERSGSAWPLEWMILPNMAKTSARSLSAAADLCDRIVSIGNQSEG
ncbi:3-carboxy-cis,cis-muconate cycloisomerase [Ruegeria sp.]|uniref:3-carboxy-cis,cis-muconate cycloisomerase n=1 Tax=Ruegeria sp. TaxID=1879320 RepID=UPI002312DB61|nr:3-carboxy-cis,cis-muconate cycloisomerase [Ruegeria sp.]MDA7965076.1 3-carboxy-cis,cis-muconate cycloisomerase [Ruegeria sp.]